MIHTVDKVREIITTRMTDMEIISRCWELEVSLSVCLIGNMRTSFTNVQIDRFQVTFLIHFVNVHFLPISHTHNQETVMH